MAILCWMFLLTCGLPWFLIPFEWQDPVTDPYPCGPVCVSDVKWIDITPDMMVQERSFDADCKRLSPGEFHPQVSFGFVPGVMSLPHCPCILRLFQIGASAGRWSPPWQPTWAKTTAMVSLVITTFALGTRRRGKALKSQETGYGSQGEGEGGWGVAWLLDHSTAVKLLFWVEESKHEMSTSHRKGLSESCCAQSCRGCCFLSQLVSLLEGRGFQQGFVYLKTWEWSRDHSYRCLSLLSWLSYFNWKKNLDYL